MSQPPSPEPMLPAILDCAIPPIEICDVGAMIEGAERYFGLLAQNLARVTGFEPNPVELATLQRITGPRRRYLPHFLGRGGPATFHITHYPGCSSLYEPDPAVINLFSWISTQPPEGNFAVERTETVQTSRLDDLTEVPPPDYLKIDVQGAELDVLCGATRALQQALVLEVEVEFVPLYKNQPLFGDIQIFLRDHDLVLHKFIDVGGRTFHPVQMGANPFAAMSQMLFADAIFVRDFTDLDLYTDEQLLKAAAILYEVYNSHDLVFHLLRGYDQRRGTTLAQRFAQAIGTIRVLPMTYLNQKLAP